MKIINKVQSIFRIKSYKSKSDRFDSVFSYKDIIQTEINNYKLLVLPRTSIGKQIMIKNAFEENDTEYLKKIIQSEWNIIDIGANIGYYTMLFAKLANKGLVYAIEPVDYHRNMIELSAWSNGFRNIKLYENLVSDKEEVLEFCISEDGAFSSIIDTQRVKTERKVNIKSITLDSLLDSLLDITHIDLLKIDAEGAEKLILLGGRNSFLNKKIKIIMIEMYDLNYTNYDTSCEEIDNMFKEYGYSGYFVENGQKVSYDSSFSNRSLNVFYQKL